MTFWLITALIVGLAVGVFAQHEQRAWAEDHVPSAYVPRLILTLTPAADQPGQPQLWPLAPEPATPLAWRAPWLSGLVAAGIVGLMGLWVEKSTR